MDARKNAWVFAPFLALLALLAGACVAEEPNDPAILLGTWRVETWYAGGVRVDRHPDYRYTFHKGKVELFVGEERIYESRCDVDGRNLDIALSMEDGTRYHWKCIYEVKDGKLRMCYLNQTNARDRPKTMEVSATTALIELIR